MIVDSPAELSVQLAAARPGETILLKAGVYEPILIAGVRAQRVTVASADPRKPAILTGLKVLNSSGLTFRDLEFQVPEGRVYVFQVQRGSRDIRFDRLNIHGVLDGNTDADGGGLLIERSENISVTRSEFQELFFGIHHTGVTGLRISGNRFHDIRMDGIRGGGSSKVLISDNSFRDFHPLGMGGTGDHADAIQFWTTNSTRSASDITVTRNDFVRGTGRHIQGIFLNDEVGNLPYRQVTITGNLIAGGEWNGVYVAGGAEVTIKDNVIAGFTDMSSEIRLKNVDGVVVTGNSANAYLIANTVTRAQVAGNVTAPKTDDAGRAAFAQWDRTRGAERRAAQTAR